MESYYVEATRSNGDNLSEDIEAEDLDQLAQFVRERFAWMEGCNDTSDVDVSWIKFKYDTVLTDDEDGNEIDMTEEAQKHI